MRILLTLLILGIGITAFGQCGAASIDAVNRPDNPTLPSNGPYCAGETVEFCYLLEFFSDATGTGNNCAWLQGIVPRFGDGWDLAQSDFFAAAPSGFNWLQQGTVDFNLPISNINLSVNSQNNLEICHNSEPNCTGNMLAIGDPLPDGWWAVSNGAAGCTNDGDPDNMWGYPQACGSVEVFEVCFELTANGTQATCGSVENLDYSIGFYIFSDGETGCWSNTSCSQYPGTTRNFSVDCNCANVVVGNNDCPPFLTINNAAIVSGNFEAGQQINVNNSAVNSTSNVFMRAGQQISLNDGFEADLGCTFEAIIDDCNP